MWKSFEGALEKRARSAHKQDFDKHTLLKIMQTALDEQFGLMGREYLELLSVENGLVRVRSKKSIWSSELLLKQKLLIERINTRYGRELIKKLVVVN